MVLQEGAQQVSLLVFGVRRDVLSGLHKSDPPSNSLILSALCGHISSTPDYTARSLPVAVASCAFLGAAVGVYDSAGKLAGDKRERDTPETWEERRRKFFKQKSSDSADA